MVLTWQGTDVKLLAKNTIKIDLSYYLRNHNQDPLIPCFTVLPSCE
jgi:hypothetical protein